jgi:hypothetical protein
MSTTTILSPERAMILTAITTLEDDARSVAQASALRGYTEGSSFNVRRPNGTGLLDILSDICIDAHLCGATDLRDAASKEYSEYQNRPGIVTTDEVLIVCSRLRAAVER